jgi:hypothetical protein
MKYTVIGIIIVLWTVLAFLYRVGAKRGAPSTWVAAAASFTWLVSTLAFAQYQGAHFLSAPRSVFTAGLVAGVGIFAAMPLFMGAVSRGNLAVSWTILTLGFAAISLASLIYPGAAVKVAGVTGLGIAAAAIALLGWDSTKGPSESRGAFKRGWGFFMTLAFVTNAGAIYMMDVAKAWAAPSGGMDPPANKAAYLATETLVFFLCSAAFCFARPARERRLTAVAIGVVIGSIFFVGNYLSFVALADCKVPAYVLFTATNGGSTVTVAFCSAVFTKERPGTIGWIGLALGVAALVLLGGAA